MPTWRSGREVGTGKIVILMARIALLSREAEADRTAADVHGVRMTIIALAWIVSLRMAVHAARVAQDGNKGEEERAVIAGGGIGMGRFRGRNIARKKECGGGEYRDEECWSESDWGTRALHTAPVMRIGKRRTRLPVTA